MILECLFIGFLFSLIKKLYEKFINKSKTAKVVLLFQFIISMILTSLFTFKIELISVLILLICLSHIFIVDLEKYLIPYASLIIIFVIGVMSVIIDIMGFEDLIYKVDSLNNRIIGFIIFLIIWIFLSILQRKVGKEFLGGGDLMLFCVFSLIIGLKSTILLLFIASFLALLSFPIIKKKQIPFGPFLTIAFLIIIFIEKKNELPF